MKFRDSYGKIVRPGDTVLIEALYRSGRQEGRTAIVSWDERTGVCGYKTDTMFTPSDFYGVHKFKKIRKIKL